MSFKRSVKFLPSKGYKVKVEKINICYINQKGIIRILKLLKECFLIK